MSWLKTDPKNGMLIGPDGCHYENEHQAAHYGLLGLCGCGRPEDAYNFCRSILATFDRRGDRAGREWIAAEEETKKLILAQPAAAAHVLAHVLTHLGLLEHGSVVGGSWLTENGARIVDLGPITEELLGQE